MIIDAYVQFGPGLDNDSPLQPPLKPSTTDDLLQILDAAGIDGAAISAPSWVGGSAGSDFVDPNYVRANFAIAEAVHAHPERLIGFARVNPKFGSQARTELVRCFDDYGFRGLYLHNESESFAYQDFQLLGPLLEECAERHRPVMAYTWLTPSQPIQLVLLAKAFASVNFVMLHSGWRLVGDAAIAAEEASNLYFDTSHTGVGFARSVTRRFGLERVIFGSAMPYAMPEVELDRVRRWSGIDEAHQEMVLGGNIARLTGWEIS